MSRYALFGEVTQALRGRGVRRVPLRIPGRGLPAAAPPHLVYRNVIIGAVYFYEYDNEQGGLLVGIQNNLRNISIVICVAALLLSLVFSGVLTSRLATPCCGPSASSGRGEYSHQVQLGATMSWPSWRTVRPAHRPPPDNGGGAPALCLRRVPRAQDPSGLHPPAHRLHPPERADGRGDRQGVCGRHRGGGRAPHPHHGEAPHPHTYGHRPPVETEPVDVKYVVEKVEHMLSPLAQAVDVRLRCRLEEGCLVQATQDDLYQIAFNLMENAIKYNLPQGEVLVTLEGTGETVFLRVEDTGVGIPEEDLPKIFDRFYRVDKARSRWAARGWASPSSGTPRASTAAR